MTINKKKLIELLVEKTGLEEQKVEEQLLQLIGRIRQEVGQGKSFQIEAFGTFSVRDNALNFKPADTLETEINHRYAGMKPIELIGAFKEAPPGEREKPEEDTESRPQEEHSREERLVETILGIKETSDSSVILNEHVPDEAEEPSGKEKTKTSFVFDTEGAEEERKTEKAEPAAVPASRKVGKEKKDPIGTALTVCVIILAVGVTGWLVYDLGFSSTAPGTNTQAQGQREQAIQAASGQPDNNLPAENGPDPSSAPSSTEESVTPEPDAVNSIQGSEENSSEAESSVYGLMGTINPEGNDGYTIVVHSIRRLNRAQSIRENLEAGGYRTIMVNAIVNGTTYWRIGLGQFETIAVAQKVTETLPEPFKSNHFIKRIQ